MKTWGKRDEPRAGEPFLNLLVPDVDAAHRRLAAKGVQFATEPHDAVWGAKIADFSDPDGDWLQLTEIRWAKYLTAIAARS